MSDAGLPTVSPKHSRSTSITTSKKTTSHQRKPSLNQQQLPASSENIKRHSGIRPTAATASASSTNIKATPRFFNSIILRVHAFLNPSGPLLPHAKHGNAFGGTSKPSFFTSLIQSRFIRFVALFYVIFSVFLTLNHSWKYMTRSVTLANKVNVKEVTSPETLDEQFGEDWIPQRTYDQGKRYTICYVKFLFSNTGSIFIDDTYSLITEMTHGLKMHKLFSKSYYDAARMIEPFWLKGTNIPEKDEVTIITTATANTWENLKRLTAYWEGKIVETYKKKYKYTVFNM
jgi:hypothetical protein